MNKQTHVEPETRHILPFLAWTFGITWGSWLILYILIALKLTSGAQPLGFVLNFIGGFGPTLGTFISLKISHPKKMLDFIFSHAKGWWIYMLAFCLVRVLTLFIANPVLPPLNAILMFPLGCTFVACAGAGMKGAAGCGAGAGTGVPPFMAAVWCRGVVGGAGGLGVLVTGALLMTPWKPSGPRVRTAVGRFVPLGGRRRCRSLPWWGGCGTA